MTSLRNNAPRRYFVDGVGRRVLIGLSLDETFEFERLDSRSASVEAGEFAGQGQVVLPTEANDQRWQELYAKHEGAWKVWIAQSRAEQAESFNLY